MSYHPARRRRIKLPVIAPGAIQAYLNRPLDSYEFMKVVPEEELLDEIRLRGHRFAASDPAWLRQLICLMIGIARPHFLFYPDMGGGKTRIAAELARYHIKHSGVRRVLLAVPETLHMTPWEEQLPLWLPDIKWRILQGNEAERARVMNSNAQFIVTYHKMLEVMMASRHHQGGMVLDQKKADNFAGQFDMLMLDEIHKVVSHDSLIARLLTWLSEYAPFRYGFTGTPHGRNPMRLWFQFKLIDHGETFGPNMGMFRAAFFDANLKTFGKDRVESVKYEFKEDMSPRLHQMIQHRSVRFGEEDIGIARLPLRWPVRLTDEGKEYYARIVKKLRESSGDYSSMQSTYIRLRQCTSGYLSLMADNEDRIEVRFKQNPKLDMLRNLLSGELADRKVIVYHHFIYTGVMIEELLEEFGIKFARIRGKGSMGGASVINEYYRFKQEDSCLILLANDRVGSEAINPQDVCNIECYVENHEDPIYRIQAEKRVLRPGQLAKTVYLHDIVAKGTVDDKLLTYHKQGRNLMSAVVDGKEYIDDLA